VNDALRNALTGLLVFYLEILIFFYLKTWVNLKLAFELGVMFLRLNIMCNWEVNFCKVKTMFTSVEVR